jgi:uncharacterized integral membrane protein
MRPRFELQLPVPRERWLAALRSLLADPPDELRGQVFRKHAVVQMNEASRTFWSPYLNLEVEDEPDGSAIRGRFSPHPNVWTLFMGIYILLAIAALAGLSYGIVQVTLGQTPWAFFIVPAAVALFGFVYGATLIGQGLGAEQMYKMRSLIDRACMQSLDAPIVQARHPMELSADG